MDGTVQEGRLQGVARVLLRPAFRALWRIHVQGLHNVPARGPAIIAPNHVSVIDSFFVPSVLPRKITYVGKVEYLDDWKTRWLFPALGMIPIDRSGGEASRAALEKALALLRAGELFGIYPEGTRARDGRLHKGRTGVARLSFESGAPVIPTGIRGTREIQPPDAPLPRPFAAAEIRFGPPMHPEPGADPADPVALRDFTDRLMQAIRELTGQEYVHEYAAAK